MTSTWIGTGTLYAELAYTLIDPNHFQFTAIIHNEDRATRQITSFEAGRMIAEVEYGEDEAVDFVHTVKKLLADLGVSEDECTHIGKFSESVARAADEAMDAVDQKGWWPVSIQMNVSVAAE